MLAWQGFKHKLGREGSMDPGGGVLRETLPYFSHPVSTLSVSPLVSSIALLTNASYVFEIFMLTSTFRCRNICLAPTNTGTKKWPVADRSSHSS